VAITSALPLEAVGSEYRVLKGEGFRGGGSSVECVETVRGFARLPQGPKRFKISN